ncbi:MAG: lysostaphin resistance A-like protein [Candidatus Bipolaricaulia bacterium]
MLRLRAAFVRVFAFYALMVSGALVIIYTWGPEVYPDDDLQWYLPNDGLAGLSLVILASWIMIRWADRRPFASLGISVHLRTPLLFVFGLALGVAMQSIALYTIGYWQAGLVPEWPIFRVMHPNWDGLVAMIHVLVFVAIIEELLFRGYAFQTISQRLGTIPALLILSVLFGLYHIIGRPDQPAYVVTTAIAGLFNGILIIRTGSLWTAIAAHWGVNLVGDEIGLLASGASNFDPAMWGFDNPQYWPIFGLMMLIIMFVPLPVDRKGQILWERYVHRPAWPPWRHRATDKTPT